MNGISGTGSRGSVRQHTQCIAVFLFWQAMLNLFPGKGMNFAKSAANAADFYATCSTTLQAVAPVAQTARETPSMFEQNGEA